MPTMTHMCTCSCIRLLFRPYRAFILPPAYSQGVALGYIIIALSGRQKHRTNVSCPFRNVTKFLEGPLRGDDMLRRIPQLTGWKPQE